MLDNRPGTDPTGPAAKERRKAMGAGARGRILAAFVGALALVVTMPALDEPASAQESETLNIPVGTHKHEGYPYQPSPPCAHYLKHDYEAPIVDTTQREVGRAQVHSGTEPYDAGPDGTYDMTYLPNTRVPYPPPGDGTGCTGDIDEIGGFTTDIEARDDDGDVWSCRGSGGTFVRRGHHIDFTFDAVPCTMTRVGNDPFLTTARIEYDLDMELCNGDMARQIPPTSCASSGAVTINTLFGPGSPPPPPPSAPGDTDCATSNETAGCDSTGSAQELPPTTTAAEEARAVADDAKYDPWRKWEAANRSHSASGDGMSASNPFPAPPPVEERVLRWDCNQQHTAANGYSRYLTCVSEKRLMNVANDLDRDFYVAKTETKVQNEALPYCRVKARVHTIKAGVEFTEPDPGSDLYLTSNGTSTSVNYGASFSYGGVTIRVDGTNSNVSNAATSWIHQYFDTHHADAKRGENHMYHVSTLYDPSTRVNTSSGGAVVVTAPHGVTPDLTYSSQIGYTTLCNLQKPPA